MSSWSISPSAWHTHMMAACTMLLLHRLRNLSASSCSSGGFFADKNLAIKMHVQCSHTARWWFLHILCGVWKTIWCATSCMVVETTSNGWCTPPHWMNMPSSNNPNVSSNSPPCLIHDTSVMARLVVSSKMSRTSFAKFLLFSGVHSFATSWYCARSFILKVATIALPHLVKYDVLPAFEAELKT